MLDPEIQSANEPQLPVPGFSESALQEGHATADSVEAFRDERTVNIRMLIQERSGLTRRAREIRIAIGNEIAALQASYAHPGDGDFVKRIESAGLAIATAYRYLGLYKESLSIEKDSQHVITASGYGKEDTAGTEKESQEACDTGENSGTEPHQPVRIRKPRRHGYVDLAELESRRVESQHALPALDVVRLEYTAEELLSFNVYVNQLCEPFGTNDRSKIVLWVLQRVCAQYGYEDCAAC